MHYKAYEYMTLGEAMESLYPGDVRTATPDQIVENAIPTIFNFDYDFFDENYKPVIEKKLLRWYYMYEVGMTLGAFQLELANLFTLNSSKWSFYYSNAVSKRINDPFINFSHQENSTRNTENTTDTTGNTSSENSTTSNTTNETTQSQDMSSTSNGISVDRNTPQGNVTTPINQLPNARNVNQNEDTNTQTTNMTNNSTGTGTSSGTMSGHDETHGTSQTTDQYIRSLTGFNGQSQASMLRELYNAFINVDQMVIDDCAILFSAYLGNYYY